MIQKQEIIFTPNSQNRTLHIYLPDDYANSQDRYPVMYFFDGHNLFSDTDATYGKCWGLKDFLDVWGKKIIIVGIECSHEGRSRLNEYSPYNFNDKYIGRVHGTGAATMDWITQVVKPMIDAKFRTYSHREATAIGGSSMGGLMSIYAAVKYNAVFSKAACLSSTLRPTFRKLAADILKEQLEPDTRVYLSWGTEEAGGTAKNPDDDWLTSTARDNLAIEALLRQQFCNTHLNCQRWGNHCEADWEKQTAEFMNYLWM